MAICCGCTSYTKAELSCRVKGVADILEVVTQMIAAEREGEGENYSLNRCLECPPGKS